MVPTADKDSHQLEVIDLESGDLDGTGNVERQDSLFREVVRGEHHGSGGHSRQVCVDLVFLQFCLSASTCLHEFLTLFLVGHPIFICRIAGGGR